MFYTFASYLRLMLPFMYLIGTWRLSDWRNWKKFYPTILFIISVDFFISNLMHEYPLWTFHGALIIPNHTIADFMITFTGFPQIILIYLSRYPYHSKWYRQVVYIAIWVILEVIIESVFMFTNLISYHHGWNFGWSCLVWVFMFIGLRLHHTKPMWAWTLCFICTAFLILHFHIPITKFR
ncbi:CBO0543 family protein [Bacillaceae bacterium C204]|uniref:CBO0543 family protein n=1 Tax=Neobacillus sp. 204 TaxID=3383351 RepID=UPI00397BC639